MRPAVALAMSAGLAAAGFGFSAVASPDPITIGLFLPSRDPGAATARQVRAGAERALARANREGGVLGRPLRLSEAASDLGWGAATGALVDLIERQRAVAVVGALDARAGHLAEQIVTRARGDAVFLTPWASEPSLTQIRIPWFFRVVPDDDQQAALLAREIFSVLRIRSAAVWVGASADARAAARALLRAAPPGRATPFGAQAEPGLDALLARAGRGEFGAVVLYDAPAEAAALASRIRAAGREILLAGPLWLAAEEFARGGPSVEGAAVVTPCAGDSGAGSSAAAASYGHDAVLAVVAALRAAGDGADGDRLAGALLQIRSGGLTGELRFDSRGQRLGGACLSVVRASRLERLSRAVPAAEGSGS